MKLSVSRRDRVADWWNNRLADGCQLAFVDDAVEGVDWVGKERWKRRVSLNALWNDFNIYNGQTMPYITFVINFQKIVRAKRVSRFAPVVFTSFLIGRRRVAYAQFGEAPAVPVPL